MQGHTHAAAHLNHLKATLRERERERKRQLETHRERERERAGGGGGRDLKACMYTW